MPSHALYILFVITCNEIYKHSIKLSLTSASLFLERFLVFHWLVPVLLCTFYHIFRQTSQVFQKDG